MKRDVYFNSVSLVEAQTVSDQLLLQSKYKIRFEEISVYDSLNRVSFESVYAKISSPGFNASAMDGIATCSKWTEDAHETNSISLADDQYIEVNTGNVIPDQFDCVIMIEDIRYNEDKSITIKKSFSLYENIRPIGEDIAMGDMIIPRYKKITPVDIAALLAGGITNIKVIMKPNIAIIPTGDEIVQSSIKINKGEIIDSNSYYLLNEIKNDGAESKIYPVVKDQYSLLEKQIIEATKNHDIILIGAGSSAGSKDFASDVVEKNGTLLVHGISIKPGKPTIIGMINSTLVIGVPGYPVSTYMTYTLIIRRVINKMLHQDNLDYKTIDAKLTKKVYSSLKNTEYIRVKLGVINNEIVCTPLNRGAGVTMSLVKSDGLLIVDRLNEGYELGAAVKVMLPETVKDISKTLVAIGSHDILLDIVNDLMSSKGYNLASSHLGSFSGVLASKNKESHISPVHILHRSGVYNKELIKEYLSPDYNLIEGVTRKQCLYVKKGNPKNIKSIKDLTKKDISFVNRQKGSGTRILLDFLLEKNEISSKHIRGYTYELPTHTTVAASVSDDRYDVGLGVVSVANLYGLDYVEVGEEHYDFIVHNDTLQLDSYRAFITELNSKEFKHKLEKLGGYYIGKPGSIKA